MAKRETGVGTLEFKWTVSRARDSAGYNICTLYFDGRKVGRCNGGGYDMKGTSLGLFIAREYKDRLLKLKEADMPENTRWVPDENPRRLCYSTKCRVEAVITEGDPYLAADVLVCPKCGGETYKDQHAGKRVVTGHSFYGLSYIDPNYDPGKEKVKHAPVFGTDADAGKTVEELEKEGKSLGLERYQAFWGATAKHPTRHHRIPHIDGACGISCVQDIMKAIKLGMQNVATRRNGPDLYILHDYKRRAKK